MANTMEEQSFLTNESDVQDTLKDMYLGFVIENEEFGIEVSHIVEIIGIQNITRVPTVPSYVKGIINLRGSIIPVIDVRLKFRKAEKEYDNLTCIVVLEVEDISIGLIVDSVKEVMTLAEENILPPPNAKFNFHNRYVKNIGKLSSDSVMLILDLTNLLDQNGAF